MSELGRAVTLQSQSKLTVKSAYIYSTYWWGHVSL